MSDTGRGLTLVVWCRRVGASVSRGVDRQRLRDAAHACCNGQHEILRVDGALVEQVGARR